MAHAEHRLALSLRDIDDPDPKVAQVLTQAKAGLGMIPNMYAAMANAPALLDTYLTGYAGFRSESGFTPAEQETVFLTISVRNGCEYCVGAHSTIADMAKVPAAVTDAIRDGGEIADPRLAALAAFTSTVLDERGLPSSEAVEEFLKAGFSETQILYIVLAIAVKTLSNYSNHLFHTPLDAMFAARSWEG